MLIRSIPNERIIMKTVHNFSFWSASVILILALVVISMGCTQPTSQSTAVTAKPTSVPGAKAPVQPAVASMVSASLPYGVTLSYPNDWTRQDVLTSGVRDYGRNTVNIANFYSPYEIPGDTLSYNSLSVDIDQNVLDDFDTYFNRATLAIGRTYDPQMQARSYTIKVSGYDAYELDFLSNDVKGNYIFTKVDDSIYIFAFKGPTKPVSIGVLSNEIPVMLKSIALNPPVTPVVKER
jgi:hypothetical protein